MKSILIIALLVLTSCASKKSVLNSNFNTVKVNKTGALVTIDLDTDGKIKRGQSCKLYIRHNETSYQMPLKEGTYNYALPLGAGMANLQELNCGAFYYYKLDDPRSTFKVVNGKLSYLGTLDFKLEDKGKMTWGPNTKKRQLLENHLGEMGLTGDEVSIEPLEL
ncbi:MAG: hypothetical protein ACJAT2_000313 [Bacteriovoracaceae bacterium]|jgi:hypothetical protein